MEDVIKYYTHSFRDFELHRIKGTDGKYWEACDVIKGNYQFRTKTKRYYSPFRYRTLQQAKDACASYHESGGFWPDGNGNTAKWIQE